MGVATSKFGRATITLGILAHISSVVYQMQVSMRPLTHNYWQHCAQSAPYCTGYSEADFEFFYVRYLLSPVRLSVVCKARAPYSGG